MIEELKNKIRENLLKKYDFYGHEFTEAELEKAINHIIEDLRQKGKVSVSENQEQILSKEIIDEILGLGPLKILIEDPSITEIMINGYQKIYIERNGKMELSSAKFKNEDQLMQIIHKILSPTRRRADESYPYTDVSLKDGSRVNIILPPLSLVGPVVTVRKFSKELKKAEDLIKLGSLNETMAKFLIAAIKAKLNIIFSGATGAGKTTALNIFSNYISNEERIISIEDTAELTLSQENVVRLEARQSNIEGKGEIGLNQLFKNALRMRPDRIIVGEIRSEEALVMLQAILSGHQGALAVIHASSPEDLISRIETIIISSNVMLPVWNIHKQIFSAIDLIVHLEQLADGSRRIMNITDVNSIEDNEIILKDIFNYEIEKIDKEGKIIGNWKLNRIKPKFLPKFKKAGIGFEELFD